MSEPGNRIVLALDYGTTFSGIAYGWAGGNHNNSNLGIEEADDGITDIQSWPVVGNVKVPSQIAYSASHEYNAQWGYDISPGALRLVWTKLELEKQNRLEELDLILKALDGMKDLNLHHIARSRGLPDYPAKEPVEIIADYLSRVRAHLIEEDLLPLLGREFFERTPIDLVVTCPTIWTDSAKNLTLKAIRDAGFNKSYFKGLNEIIFLPEPVAAALYVLKSLEQEEGEPIIKAGDCFVAADCGGGTVDVAAFRVSQVEPVTTLQEIGIGIGKKCGSTYIDRELMDLVRRKLGPNNYRKLVNEIPEGAIGGHGALGPSLADILEKLRIMKENFDGSDNAQILVLPGILGGLNIPENNIVNGDLQITGQELRKAFHSSVEGTIELVAAQIGQVRRMGSQVRFVTLSGGFSRSAYLFREVSQFTAMQHVPTKRPADKDRCWSAVARGAVMHGLQRRTEQTVFMRAALRNYGVKTQQPFSALKHSMDTISQDALDEQQKAQNQMTWLVKKGDLILSSTPTYATLDICRKFQAQDNKNFCTHLLANDDDRSGTEYLQNEMTIVGQLQYNLNSLPDTAFQKIRVPGSKKQFYRADLKLHIQITHNESVSNIRFWVTFNGQVLSSFTKPYP